MSRCAMCEWIANASLHPKYAAERLASHRCEEYMEEKTMPEKSTAKILGILRERARAARLKDTFAPLPLIQKTVAEELCDAKEEIRWLRPALDTASTHGSIVQLALKNLMAVTGRHSIAVSVAELPEEYQHDFGTETIVLELQETEYQGKKCWFVGVKINEIL